MNACASAKNLRDKGDRLVKRAQMMEHEIYTKATQAGRGSAPSLLTQRAVVADLYKKARGAYVKASALWDQGRCGAGLRGGRSRKRKKSG